MKKITLLFLLLTSSIISAQTVVWSSDSESLTGWGASDFDGDGNSWGTLNSVESIGFNTGTVLFSESWQENDTETGLALTPDNRLYTPTFFIPETATSITFKMKVAAAEPTYFAEKYAVYVYDSNNSEAPATLIHQETLTAGGLNSAKDIAVAIPTSFANKTIGVLIRHFDCTDQFLLLIDDFEVSYTTTLSTEDNTLNIAGVYPNPVKDQVKIQTNEIVDAVSITNQLGQRVLDIKKTSIIDNTVDLSVLDKGVYFMNVRIEDKSQAIKIIKQ
ncbi:T9SS type A sorting domain-containing protein [Mariniflexile sp.]|uniref:T9SS type A sorting domain-containing protein n=1 Tax=Mariniflexile sp. TaxID=1979402 RepID=UPI003566663D